MKSRAKTSFLKSTHTRYNHCFEWSRRQTRLSHAEHDHILRCLPQRTASIFLNLHYKSTDFLTFTFTSSHSTTFFQTFRAIQLPFFILVTPKQSYQQAAVSMEVLHSLTIQLKGSTRIHPNMQLEFLTVSFFHLNQSSATL